jgi:hypothetical protein
MESRELERLRYRHGQTIRGLDFRDQRRIEDQLRAWHNRALHNVYGVAKKILGGLKVKFEQGYFHVESGLAYDCFGRPLLRCEDTRVPPGQQEEPMYLVIRQKSGCGCQSVHAPASCFPAHHSLIAEDTELVWLPKKNFSFRDGVPLALTKIVSGVIDNDQTFIAPAARALARPRISSGTTIPGATTWEVLDLSNTEVPELTEVRVRIDTSSAGFASIPEYFALLQGPLTTIESPGEIGILCLHFDHIERMRADGFVFSFFILVFNVDTDELTKQIPKFLNQQKAYVSWIGFERNPGDGLFSA